MEEFFDLKDKNRLFSTAKAMHDEVMTHIEAVGNKIQLDYGEIGTNPYWHPFRAVTVSYRLDDLDSDYSLTIKKLNRDGRVVDFSINDPGRILDLNPWHMMMFKFDIDQWGEMTLHFSMDKGKQHRYAELRFTPASIRYRWEE